MMRSPAVIPLGVLLQLCYAYLPCLRARHSILGAAKTAGSSSFNQYVSTKTFATNASTQKKRVVSRVIDGTNGRAPKRIAVDTAPHKTFSDLRSSNKKRKHSKLQGVRDPTAGSGKIELKSGSKSF
jgi:hypothetical protein